VSTSRTQWRKRTCTEHTQAASLPFRALDNNNCARLASHKSNLSQRRRAEIRKLPNSKPELKKLQDLKFLILKVLSCLVLIKEVRNLITYWQLTVAVKSQEWGLMIWGSGGGSNE